MSDSAPNKENAASQKPDHTEEHDHDGLDDQEKILAGRRDVNYPAMLTKDVKGG
jgi:hypothetical protein